ncbi:DNA topoisomerase 2 [Massospora cicadina]|nr:DNA topoisomerase 2 [Massospora cicadina]
MQLEHILLRPDMYISSTKMNTQRHLCPELIFGHLLTSSNYNNSKKKVVSRHNGYRAKLCNIFSTEFIVEIVSKESGNKKFQMNNLNADILKSAPGPDGEELTKRLVFKWISKYWEVSFVPSNSGQLQQVSFVNSILTSKGGTHVNYVVDANVKLIQEALDKKKLKCKILPWVIKANMWSFFNCLIENPSFDLQTNKTITLKPTNFGSNCKLMEKFQVEVIKSGIINMLTALSQAKDNMAMIKVLDSTKSRRILGIPSWRMPTRWEHLFSRPSQEPGV